MLLVFKDILGVRCYWMNTIDQQEHIWSEGGELGGGGGLRVDTNNLKGLKSKD